MKKFNMKTNNLHRRDFIKKSVVVSAGIMISPDQKAGAMSQMPDYRKRLSFLNKPYPVISGIIAGQTPQELVASARNSESEGAMGITIDLHDLKPEFRNSESFKSIINSVNLPFMFYFYRGDKWKKSSDDDRQEVLLAAAEAGASMIDVMGDLYDPSPKEITYSQNAIDKQKRLIEQNPQQRRRCCNILTYRMPADN
jgi:hypothetical protein